MIEVKIDTEGTQVSAKGRLSELQIEVMFLALSGARLMYNVGHNNALDFYKKALQAVIDDPFLEEYAKAESDRTELAQIDLRELWRQMQQGGDTTDG